MTTILVLAGTFGGFLLGVAVMCLLSMGATTERHEHDELPVSGRAHLGHWGGMAPPR